MSKGNKNKLFTFIHGGDLHFAPGKKVIPESEYSILFDANHIKSKVLEDAELYRKEIADEVEKERTVARQEGYRAGLKEFSKHLEALEKKVEQLESEMKKSIVPMAIKAAQKIVGKETSLDKEVIVDIIKNTLKAVSSAQFIKIYVNKQDLEVLEKNREQIKEGFERLNTLTLEARDDIKIGDCVIETETGIINFEMEHKWAQLQEAMSQLFNSTSGGE